MKVTTDKHRDAFMSARKVRTQPNAMTAMTFLSGVRSGLWWTDRKQKLNVLLGHAKMTSAFGMARGPSGSTRQQGGGNVSWCLRGRRVPRILGGRHRWKPQNRKKGGRACEEPICRSLWIRNFRRSSPYRKSSAIDQTSLGLGGWGSINFRYNWRILSIWTSTFHGPFAHESPNSTLLKRPTAIYHFLCHLTDQRVSFSG